MLSRLFALFVVFLALTTYSCAQTTSSESPTTPANTTTESPTNPANTTTESPTNPANTTTESPTTPANTTTESPTNPANTTTESPTNPANTTTESPTNPANTTTESPTNPANTTTESPTNPANTTTESPTNPANTTTESPTNPANTTTESPTTPAPTTTESPSPTSSDSPPESPTTPAPTTTESPTTTAPTTTESPTTPAPTTTDCICNTGEKCTADCLCNGEYNHLSLDGYCAEPCNNKFRWCTGWYSMCKPSDDKKDYGCVCNAGSYNQAGTCEKGKYFGGKITFTENYKDNFDESASKIKDILDNIYSSTPYYLGSIVLDIVSGSTIATYQLNYQDQTDVTELTLQDNFEESTGCNGTVTEIDIMPGYTMNCTASRMSVVEDNILCITPNSNLSSGCDNATADCDTDGDGNFFCSCKDNYAKASAGSITCLKIKCTVDSECGPFGVCNKNEEADQLDNICDCFFGFSGDQCQEPWEFVFTVVTAGLGLILIVVVTAFICKSSTTKTTAKSTKQEDMDLQNPFVDFQPGIVRAKVPSNMYSVSDSYEAANGGQAHTNGAYNNAYDELNTRQTSTFSGEQRQSQKNNYEYF